jgi:hypothetical protein
MHEYMKEADTQAVTEDKANFGTKDFEIAKN